MTFEQQKKIINKLLLTTNPQAAKKALRESKLFDWCDPRLHLKLTGYIEYLISKGA